MRMLLTGFAVLAFSTPTLAQETCRYVSGVDIGTVEFFAGDDSKAVIGWSSGENEVCDYTLGDEGGSLMICPQLGEENFSFAGTSLFDSSEDILIFLDTAWYRECTEGV